MTLGYFSHASFLITRDKGIRCQVPDFGQEIDLWNRLFFNNGTD